MRRPKITGAVQTFVFILAIVAASAHGATSATHGVDDSRIAVTDVAGRIDVTMAGEAVAVRRDSTVLLPARIVTGHDGMLGMTQAGTNITVSNDTDVEIPAEAVDGNLVARLVQHQGNVFYDVAPRELGKLRVETPLLVAVIKGTQFNVAVQSDSTTISLFEGQLEILTPDGSDVVQLNAGEIAIRSLTDDVIRVVGMDDVRVAAPQAAAARSANAGDARTAPRVEIPNGVAVVNRGVVVGAAGGAEGVVQKPTVTAELDKVDLGTRVDTGVAATVDLGAATLDVAAGTTLDVRAAAADVAVGATLDLGAASADVGVGATVDLGAASTDVGVGTAVDLGVAGADVDVGAALDLGAASPAVDVDAGLDLGGVDAGVGVATDVDVDLGGATADVGLDTGVDLGAGSLDVGLDAGVDLSASPADLSVGADVGADLDLGGLVAADVGASVDLGGGLDLGATLDLGGELDLGGALDLEVDLDLGTTEETGSETTTPPPGGLLGGLGGLLSRP
jgi:hypothetical protein